MRTPSHVRTSSELRGQRAADALVWLIFAADAICDRFRAVSS